jgi:chemotaxis protein MotB
MAGGGGGAWKVAYADFVTAMMAFFLVMWLVGQDNAKKEAISEYFSDPWARSRVTTNLSRNPTIKQVRSGDSNPNKKYLGSNPHAIPHEDPEAPDRKTPKLVTVRAPERTTAGTIVYFDEGSSGLTPEAQAALKNLLPSLSGLIHKIDIRGHLSPQSGVGQGRDDQLWDLSYSRCMQVMDFLQSLGIEPQRMRVSLAGPYEPLSLAPDEVTARKNARVEIFMVNETVEALQGTPADRKAKQSSSAHRDTEPEPSSAHGPHGKGKSSHH